MDYLPGYGSAFTDSSGLTYKDFLPSCIKGGGFFSNPEYENFGTLVQRANEWLKSYCQWEINTCESVEFKARSIGVDPTKMLYREYGRYRTSFMRGLRLWLKRRSPEDEGQVQNIDYLNLIPEKKAPSSIFSSFNYETLDELLMRFNSNSKSTPIPGHIVTVETQEMKVKSDGDINPDRSSWTESGQQLDRFVYIIRIFYILGKPQYEEISLTDFTPELTPKDCCGVAYEPFSALVERAATWSSRLYNAKICNIQSVAIKYKMHEGAGSRKMCYTEHGDNAITTYVRILRIAHIHKINKNTVGLFSCKTFTPVILESGHCFTNFEPKLENLNQTMERVSSWIQSTGVEVLNVETSAVRIKRKGLEHSQQKTYFYDPRKGDEYFMFVIRLYMLGTYSEQENTWENNPPIPVYKCCSIM